MVSDWVVDLSTRQPTDKILLQFASQLPSLYCLIHKIRPEICSQWVENFGCLVFYKTKQCYFFDGQNYVGSLLHGIHCLRN